MIVLTLLSEQMLKLWLWKTRKGHGRSGNFKIVKEYEPWLNLSCSVVKMQNQFIFDIQMKTVLSVSRLTLIYLLVAMMT